MPNTAGIYEVGRGSLAGPIFAAVAVFDSFREDCPVPDIKDSKLYADESHRERAFRALLLCPELLGFAWGEVDNTVIDQKGINWANQEVFQLALCAVQVPIDYLIVDGKMPVEHWPRAQDVKPKADRDHWQVGAASVIAKVLRDRLMHDWAKVYPAYSWETNKGYGSMRHQQGLLQAGLSPLHRRSFCRKWMAGEPAGNF